MRSLETYLQILDSLDALPAYLLREPETSLDLSFLKRWPQVSLPPELEQYFSLVPGYSWKKVRAIEARSSNTPFIIGETGLIPYFAPVDVKRLYDEMKFRDVFFDPGDGSSALAYDYVGIGFVPFLTDHNGEYHFVNCDPASHSYAAVFTLYEGIGCIRKANSLPQFFEAATMLLEDGDFYVDEWGSLEQGEDANEAWRDATGLPLLNGERDW